MSAWATEWEIVPPEPRPHVCKLPDAKEFPLGTRIVCTGHLPQFRAEPPKAHRAKNYSYTPPPPIACQKRYRRGKTFWLQDPTWKEY